MKTITICAAKGGTTKTTVTLSLAVRACQESPRVALFDMNGDQGDLTKWWILRGEPMITRLLDVDNISRGVEAARAAGYDWLFLDGPPGDLDIIENCVVKADAVVIPVRTGFFDIDAVTPVVEMCRQSKKPYAFLLSAVDSKMPRLTELAMAGLAGEGPIFATRIRYLQPYILSVSKGKSAAEIDRGCQSEIDSLWGEVKRFAGEAQQPQLTAVIGGKA